MKEMDKIDPIIKEFANVANLLQFLKYLLSITNPLIKTEIRNKL